MVTPVLILVIVLLLVLGGASVFLLMFMLRPPVKESVKPAISFHWSFIIVPLVVLLVSLILTAYFYSRLPAEVAFDFKSAGPPDRWVSRGTLILWLLIPQVILTLLAAAITYGITKLGVLTRQTEDNQVKPERLLSLMGNLVGLPQIIFCFALADVFSYNSYQTHIMSLWVFAVIVLGVGAVILTGFLISIVRRAIR